MMVSPVIALLYDTCEINYVVSFISMSNIPCGMSCSHEPMTTLVGKTILCSHDMFKGKFAKLNQNSFRCQFFHMLIYLETQKIPWKLSANKRPFFITSSFGTLFNTWFTYYTCQVADWFMLELAKSYF